MSHEADNFTSPSSEWIFKITYFILLDFVRQTAVIASKLVNPTASVPPSAFIIFDRAAHKVLGCNSLYPSLGRFMFYPSLYVMPEIYSGS